MATNKVNITPTSEVESGWTAYQIDGAPNTPNTGAVSGVGVVIDTGNGVCFIPNTKIVEIRERGTKKLIRKEIKSIYLKGGQYNALTPDIEYVGELKTTPPANELIRKDSGSESNSGKTTKPKEKDVSTILGDLGDI